MMGGDVSHGKSIRIELDLAAESMLSCIPAHRASHRGLLNEKISCKDHMPTRRRNKSKVGTLRQPDGRRCLAVKHIDRVSSCCSTHIYPSSVNLILSMALTVWMAAM